MSGLPNKLIYIYLSRAKKIEKTNSFIFASLTNTELDVIQRQQAAIERSINDLKQNYIGVNIQAHVASDEELTNILASMVSDAKDVVKLAGPEDKKDEIEKRLIKAWELLNGSKSKPKDDLLDCHRLHTVMVEIRDRVDSILNLALDKGTGPPKRISLILVPLERIQSKAGNGSRIAWKQSPAHSPTGGRTQEVLEAGNIIADVLGEAYAFIKLT